MWLSTDLLKQKDKLNFSILKKINFLLKYDDNVIVIIVIINTIINAISNFYFSY